MLQVTVGLGPPLNSVVWISPLSRVRCCVRFGLSVLVGQRHFVHVHGADAGLGHRQQQHRHTDGTAGRESVIAVPVGRSDWLSSPPSKFKISAVSFSSVLLPPVLCFPCSVCLFFCFCPLVVHLLLFNVKQRTSFSPVWAAWSFIFPFCFGWSAALRWRALCPLVRWAMLYFSTWSSTYDVCIHADYQVSRSLFFGGGAGGLAVWSICLYLNSFIFLVNPNL